MSDRNRPPKTSSPAPSSSAGARDHQSTSPTGTPRAGRRATARHQTNEPAIQRFRTPILVLVVIALVGGVSLFVLTSATAPAYACTTVDTVRTAAADELGQVQADMGRGHTQSGDKVTFAVCPPASGKHLNKNGFGPLQPKVYGPDDQSLPNGWIHNLEHGGLVLLYSCDKGACDDASLQKLRNLNAGFPASAICGLPAGTVGPVVARFEQMPTKYAALVWDRVLYLDNLDGTEVYDFYSRYGERVQDGIFVAPPEPQCAVPSPSAPAGAPAEPSPAAS